MRRAGALLEPRSRPGGLKRGDGDGGAVGALVSLLAAAASASLVATAGHMWDSATETPAVFASFLTMTVGLQLMGVKVYGRGSISVAGIGMLAIGFAFGIGAAMTAGVLCALAQGVRTRGKVHRILFNAATLSLAAGLGTLAYQLLGGTHYGTLGRLGPAIAAGAVNWAVNISLLTFVLSLAEEASFLAIWRERYRWLTPHYLAFGPLALASAIAYEKVGLVGVIAFIVPPALLMISVRQYLERTRAAVQEVRLANEELRRTNAELAERNADLHELFQFAGGLAVRATDRRELVDFAESSLERLTGTPAQVTVGEEPGGIPLFAGGIRVGSIEFEGGPQLEQWERLRQTLLPQLATAIESAELVEKVRKTHLATIAALSRSMEAKDYYTGGHTERVASVSVALAKRFGYTGPELDAVEIGALLHDIGKIGIPERILHKPGPLNDEEWKIMKEHPVISDYILSEVEVSPVVRQIARSSHERIDGKGYPDGLAGEEIPLAARIVLVADAFDALTSDRPYRRARHTSAALEELRAHSGTQFCPRVIAALERVYREDPQVLASEGLKAVRVA